MKELRQYQIDAIGAIRQSVAQGVRRLVVQAPTGSGKTRMTAAIIEGALSKGNRVAFVVPYLSLIDQALCMFYDEGIADVGVMQAYHPNTDGSKPVQICSIQTLQSRGIFPDAKIVIIDEVHLLHEHHKRWINNPEWQGKIFLGLSATPFTKGLGKYFESLLIAATTQDLIRDGYLSPFRVFATGHPDLSGVKIVAGEYHEGQLSEAMQGGTLTADIVSTWKERWGKDKTLCFAVDCAHARSIQGRFESEGIKCAYQDARTPMSERGEIKRAFHSGDIQVVSNVDTLSVGVDFDVRCLILARPTRSEAKFVQIVGRGLRTADGKESLILLDHSDTTQRLGFVTDIQHDRLDDGKPKNKSVAKEVAPLPKSCPQCAMLRPLGVIKCPNCGFESVRMNKHWEKEGQLVEVSAGERAPKQTPSAKKFPDKQAAYGQLLFYSRQHGYMDGWASRKYREIYGVWPAKVSGIPLFEPTLEMASWIKSTQIRYAKEKEKEKSLSSRSQSSQSASGA